MGFSKQEYWNGLPAPSPEDTLNQKCVYILQTALNKFVYKDFFGVYQ